MTAGALGRGVAKSGAVALMLAVSVCLIHLSYQRLAADLFQRQALALVRSAGPTAVGAGQALSTAFQTAPWNPRSAWIAGDSFGDPGPDAALRWSPADPFLWQSRVRNLAERGRFGDEMAAALSVVNELAPALAVLHEENAETALRFWPRGNPQVREQWLISLRFLLRRDERGFLRGIERAGRAQQLCWTAGLDLPIGAWCDMRFPPG